MTDAVMLLIDEIRRDGGTQIRVEFDETTADEFAELLMDGHEFPPVTVFFDGAEYWLADGFHRMRAHERAWRLEIAADVRQGSRRDAILYAVGANAAHGIRRSDRDKRNAVETLLKDEEWLAKGFRWVGRQAAVSEGLVRRVYADLSAYRTQIAKPAVRTVERGGAVFPMDTANIGARPAAADPVQQPEWRQTDIEEIAPGAPAPEAVLQFPPNRPQHRLAGAAVRQALETIAEEIDKVSPSEAIDAAGGELWTDAADAEKVIPWLTEFMRLVPDEMSRRERSQPYLKGYRRRTSGK